MVVSAFPFTMSGADFTADFASDLDLTDSSCPTETGRAEAIFGSKQAMVPAARLVDGEFVTLHDDATMTVYQLDFDAPHVLYVDGLEVGVH